MYKVTLEFMYYGNDTIKRYVSVLRLECEHLEGQPLIDKISGTHPILGRNLLEFTMRVKISNLIWERENKYTDECIVIKNHNGGRIHSLKDVTSDEIDFTVWNNCGMSLNVILIDEPSQEK